MRILFMLSLLLLSIASYSCQLVVRMENFNPESRLTPNKSWKGIDVELIQKLLMQAGCQFSIIELPWARSLDMLANGEIDMMINVTKTKEREASFNFIGPIRNEVIVLATDAETPVILSNITDILKLEKPIAVQRGSFYGPVIEKLRLSKAGKDNFVQVIDNDTKILLMRAGRISGFLEAKRNLTIGPERIARYEGIWFHPLIIHQSPVYFALSKKSVKAPLFKRIQSAFKANDVLQ